MSIFWKIWQALFSCNTRFEIRLFTLLPANFHFSEIIIVFKNLILLCKFDRPSAVNYFCLLINM